MMRRHLIGLLVLVLAVAVAQPGLAQTATSGQITGDVTDPSGAVVAGAKVAVTSDAGLQRTATTDASGHYAFPLLPPGAYKLQVSMTGFNAVTLQNIAVRITETAVVHVPLQVQTTKEVVEVRAAPPLVQSESATTGKVIEQAEIRQLPLPTRNFQQLLALTAGASGSVANSSELGRGDAVVYVNGQRAMSNAVVINGVDANSIGTGSTPNLAVPATDSMREFIVQTSLYDATQGRSAGGAVAAVTKSGDNALHGNVYEFLRNSSLNANNFFLNRAGVQKPVLNRNLFGGTLGGPIKRDHAWFFVSYQGTREKNGASLLNSLSTVLVPGVLTDDRSDAGLSNLYSAYFGSALGPLYYSVYKTSPQVALLKAKAADGFWAIPSAATATGTTAPVSTPIPTVSRFREDQFNSNVDLQLSQANRLGVKFFFANNPTHQGLYSFAGVQNAIQAPGYPVDLDINQRLLAIDDTHVFSPTLLNYARFGFSYIGANSRPKEQIMASDLGITSPLRSLFAGMPTLSFSNLFDVGASPLADNISQTRTFTAGDMLTWTRGRHTIKFGGEYKHHQSELVFNAYTRGEMFFLGVTGDPFKDFLSGMPGLTVIGSGDPRRDNRAQDFAGFYQDDWRITPRLTLNIGLRYDYYGPFTEAKGRFVAFDPALAQTVPLPTGGVALTSGFVQAGNGNLQGITKGTDGLVAPDRNNFAPRFGFAWQPGKSNDFVIRGGYGVYYDRANARLFNSQVFNSPYYMIATSLVGTTWWPQMNNPFVQVPTPSSFPLNLYGTTPASLNTPFTMLVGGVPTPVTLPTNIPAAGIYPDRHDFRVPYIQQYNFGVQYNFAANWLLDLGYVGSTGRKLYRLMSANQAPTPGVAGVFAAPLYPGLSSLAVPVFGTYLVQSSSNSNYNSLQASVTKRLSHGLSFLASYTWSKSIDDYSGTDVSDLSVVPGDQVRLNNRGRSDFDRRHRFVLSGSYDLPKLYQGNAGFGRQVANNWQLNTILTGQTGTPFTIVGDASAFAQTRADLTNGWSASDCGSGAIHDARLRSYFDPTAFKLPTGAGNFGTTGRNICRGPAQVNVDLSVAKFFPVTESQRIEFRAEFFNAFNNVNFANPIAIASSKNFGNIVRTSTGPRVIQFALKYNF